jgi:hypothetical protein
MLVSAAAQGRVWCFVDLVADECWWAIFGLFVGREVLACLICTVRTHVRNVARCVKISVEKGVRLLYDDGGDEDRRHRPILDNAQRPA